MAFKRKFIAKNRRRVHKKKPLTARVKRVERLIRQNRAELRYLENFAANANTSWSGAITNICTPTQGDAVQMRQGDRIRLKSILLQGHFNSGATTAYARVILVRSINLGVASVSDVLATGYLGTGNAVDAPYTYDNRVNFKVLWDRKFTFSANGTNAISFTKYIRLNNKILQFDAATATPSNNGIFMIVVSANAAGATPTYSHVSRVHYTDN